MTSLTPGPARVGRGAWLLVAEKQPPAADLARALRPAPAAPEGEG
ncbi:hypothetical protein AB0C76_15065 [Kitasatospora sp. NPDC048722]